MAESRIPRDINIANWRPRSQKISFLILTTSLTGILLLVFASLHFLNDRNGALFRSNLGWTLPSPELFSSRYLPTILAVLYGLWISAIDLDIKRLEPWYRLSEPAAQDRPSPLLCKYDTDFILSVIWKASLSRHWVVVGSSFLLIIASVLLPATLNSAFTTRREFVVHDIEVGQSLQLASPIQQSTQVYNNFLLISYAITWLGQSIPQFTTKEYALAPFANDLVQHASNIDRYTNSYSKTPNTEGYITYPTKRYWTELECWSPAAVAINLTTSSVSFDDGRGCFATDMLSFNTSITDQYTSGAGFEAYVYGPGSKGYDPFIPSLQSQCADSPHLFLMTFRRAGSSLPDFGRGGNATAMFCEPSYYWEFVNATVVASNSTIIDYVTTGPRQSLSGLDFNATRFEYIITNGAPPRSDVFQNLTLIVDINDAAYVAQSPRIGDMDVITPLQASGDMTIGFALGTTKLPAKDYIDFDTLSMAYNRAHQLLFAQAISFSFLEESSSSNKSATESSGTIRKGQAARQIVQEDTIQIVSTFAIATELCLMTSILLCALLLFTIPQRALHLKKNPDSLAEAMLLSGDDSVQKVFQNLNQASEKSLNAAVGTGWFHLDASSGLLIADRKIRRISSDSKDIGAFNRSANIKLQPIELSRRASTSVIVLIASGSTGLFFTYFRINANDGLQLPSKSNDVNQLLLNFVPTAAVTLLGMYLFLLCRVLAFMQPMQDLVGGDASADKTILAKYNTLPPQLLGLTAFRSKHYLLGILSMAVLGSSVLTVTAASIYTIRDVEIPLSVQIAIGSNLDFASMRSSIKNRTGSLNNKLDSDAMYSNYANFTANMPLSSWTTPEYAIVPRNLVDQDVLKYALAADAYSASIECFDFFQPPVGVQTSLDFFSNGSTLTLFANFTHTDQSISSCTFNHANYIGPPSLGLLSTSNSALELATTLLRWNASGAFSDEFCGQIILKGWIRGRKAESKVNTGMPIEYNATIAVCEASIQRQQVHVSTTAEGNIISVRPLSEPTTMLDPSNALQTSLNVSIVNMRANTNSPDWHNDTIAQDFPNRLFVDLLGSRNWLNATLQPPSYDSAVETMSKLFKRLFAVQVSADRNRLVYVPILDDSVDPSQSAKSSSEVSSPAQAVRLGRRVFISKPNFIISVVILAFDLLVLVTFQLNLPRPFLPRMPFTIASQIAFFSNSHILDDLLEQSLDLRAFRYGYGKFVGKDGRVHIGIEREPFVYPLEQITETSGKRRISLRRKFWNMRRSGHYQSSPE